ncbi:MAG: GuaB3 family IMP dehydrogenase-related protein [Mycobacteriales bacterium]
MTDIEIGIGKTGRRTYAFDDVSIVPSRRTRDRSEVSLAWEMDAYRFGLPILSAPADSVTSPAVATEMSGLGGLGVLDLEGLWTRYEDPLPVLEQLAEVPPDEAVAALRKAYEPPVSEALVAQRVAEMKAEGIITAGALTPSRTAELHKIAIDAGLDLLVIQGSVVSAEHVSTTQEPLNLKTFIAGLDTPVIVGGCANYTTALHLMRTGAAGVLVGIGASRSRASEGVLGLGVPMATAIADAAGARRDYLDESGGRYVHVIADGGMRTGADIAKAVACGADAVMLGLPLAHSDSAPGRGWHWSSGAYHRELPRGARLETPPIGSLEEVLVGPTARAGGSTNLAGGLRTAMALTGYSSLKEFQKVELAVR